MKFRSALVVTASASLLFSGFVPTANASQPMAEQTIPGIIVQYSKDVAPIAKNGEPTGANLIRSEVDSLHLGGDLYALKFVEPLEIELVRGWVARMTLDRRIVWADLDSALNTTASTPLTAPIGIVKKARAASAPRSVAVRNASRSSSPEQARIRLSWKAPANRYGATVVGYRIQYSADGSGFRTLINNTGTSDTRAFLSDGIRAGVNYRFRVRALTNDGSGTDTIGSASSVVSILVRTAPKPVFLTTQSIVGPGNARFVEQSLSDRGGFAKSQVRYRAIATAANIESVESSLCSSTRCRFPDLLPDTSYTVEIIATNALGSTSSAKAQSTSDLYFPVQWYLTGAYGVSMPSAWNYGKGDGDKVVAVIDTGIKDHQQISKRLTRNADGSIYGYDFVSDIASAADGDGEDPNPNDEGGDASGGNSYHGTHVAGIIASEHDFVGTAGVAPNVKILPVRALGRDGGTVSDLLRAINWAAGVRLEGVPTNRLKVSVINLSLGAKEPVPCSGAYSTVFETALNKGISVVVAAGNESRASLSFPANCPGVIPIVATQSLGDRAGYSNYGPEALLSAPGGDVNIGSTEAPDSRGAIISAWVDDLNLPSYRLSEGTSMAAPVVSGVVGLMYSMQPSITPAQVRSILQKSVKAFPVGSNCATFSGCGSGILDAQLALLRTSALK